MKSRLAIPLAVALFSGVPGLAWAQGSGCPEASRLQGLAPYYQHYCLGELALAARDARKALVHFKQSFELDPKVQTALVLARLHRQMAQWDDAIRYYERVVVDPAAKAAGLDGDAQRELYVVLRQPELDLQSRPPGADVVLTDRDETRQCRTPCKMRVSEGAVSVTLTLHSDTHREDVQVAMGARREVAVAFEGGLLLSGSGWAGVVRAGARTLTVGTPERVPAGTYEIETSDPSGKVYHRVVEVRAGEVATITLPTQPDTAPEGGEMLQAGWALLAAGAAAVVLGAVFGGLALDEEAEYGAVNGSDPGRARALHRDVALHAGISDAGLFGGSAVALTGIVLLIIDAAQAPPATGAPAGDWSIRF